MKYVDGNLHIGANALLMIYNEEDSYILEHPEYWEGNGYTQEDMNELTTVLDAFEVADREALANEDFYQGMNFIFVLRRKEDGACFGVSYFYMGGEYGESQIYDAYDWAVGMYELKPVELASIPTFKFVEESKS